jgi:hypothetical protein
MSQGNVFGRLRRRERARLHAVLTALANCHAQMLGSRRPAALSERGHPDRRRALGLSASDAGRARNGSTREFRVEHPVWAVQPVERFDISVDFARLYGPEWAFLNDDQPSHVSYAAGSPVSVYPPRAWSARCAS